MGNKKRLILILLACMCALVLVFVGVDTYTTAINDRLALSTSATLDEIASQQQFSFDSELSTEMTLLQSVSNTLTIIGNNEKSIVEYIQTIEKYHQFRNICVVEETGLGVCSSGEYVDLSADSTFITAAQGTTSLSEPKASMFEGDTVVTMAAPIFEYGKIEGVVYVEYSLDYLDSILLPSFDGDGYAFVANTDGDLVAGTENDYSVITDNLFDIFLLSDFIVSSATEVRENVENGEAGSAVYEIDGIVRMMEYRPLDFNGWSLMVVVPEVVISDNANAILDVVNTYNYIVITCTVGLVVLIALVLRRTIKEIEKAAYYDELTGIPNMTKLKLQISEIMQKNPEVRNTLIKFDVVNFKAINEMFDYDTGNRVLKAIADVGKESSVEGFLQARVGTDEFMLYGPTDFFDNLEVLRITHEEMFAQKVQELNSYKFEFRYGRYTIRDNSADINDIFDKVALAHSFAKTQNEIICDYDEEYKEHVVKTTEIKNKMAVALDNDEYKVYLQPKYNLTNDTVVGAEALVRWVEPNGNMIFPNDFIPVFESTGFIVDLDKYMLRGVCKALAEWKSDGLPIVPISVNFSRLHLDNPDFVGEIANIVDEYAIERKYLEVELTETTIIDNERALQRVLEELHTGGFALSMDDFGSGYSSLGLLKGLNVDVIKMDRSFFTDADNADRGNLVVESVVEMAKKLGITTVAEGVETREQAEFLKSVDCEIAQGYFYSRPIPAEEFKYLCLGAKRND